MSANRPSTAGAGTPALYQLKATLRMVRPPIWRRLLVPSDIRLRKLHMVMQAATGWTNIHLYEFSAGNDAFGDPDEDAPPSLRSARTATLSSVAPSVGSTLVYEYDFGDGWRCDIKVEAIGTPEEGMRYPVCVAGKRAWPPDDSGGPHAYPDFLEAFRDPQHPEHEEKRDWIGEFDPEAFDLDTVNARLRRVR